MPLRIQRDQPITRICGTLLGIGFVLVGAFAILGATELAMGVNHERAMGFGTTAIIVGIIAVLCSLLVKDLSNIWCRHPRRWK
jgi:chromate transport protein ChrA